EVRALVLRALRPVLDQVDKAKDPVLGHEDVAGDGRVAAGPPQTAHEPVVDDLELGPAHEEDAHLRLPWLELHDRRLEHPLGMQRAGVEPPLAIHPEPAVDPDRLAGGDERAGGPDTG